MSYVAVWSLQGGIADPAEPLSALDEERAEYQAAMDEKPKYRETVVWNNGVDDGFVPRQPAQRVSVSRHYMAVR